jgi:hypothetical protein
MSPLLIKISKDFATLWTTIDQWLSPRAAVAKALAGQGFVESENLT